MKERVKPHISRLPVVAFPKYEPRDTKIAVSIPLFRSSVDSGKLSDFDETRFREIHIKGAVWAAMGIIHNTDLGQKGVPIYFHIEETLREIVLDEMAKYEVPVFDMVRLAKIPEAKDKTIQYPQYGKKLMCVNDTSIGCDTWLIVDSDAFACTTGQRLQWYDYLSKLQNPAPLIVWDYDYKEKYAEWVKGVAMGTGQGFFIESLSVLTGITGNELSPAELMDRDMRHQHDMELKCLKSIGLDFKPDSPDKNGVRTCTSTHILALPTQHPIVPFLQDRYHNCYQDEFLLSLWQMAHKDMVSLKDDLNITHYKKETPFVERDKTTDKDGYLAHITPDYGKTEQTQVDAYFDKFYNGLKASSAVSSQPVVKPKRKQPEQLRLHVFGVAYGVSDKTMLSSPFVQRTVKFPEMMKNLGHHVTFYGHERSDVVCDEFVPVTNDDVIKRTYGSCDHTVPPDKVKPDDIAFRYFHANAERELRKRVQPDDIVLSFFGFGDKPLCDRIKDLPCHIVEASIGYPDSFADYRVYQSPSKMHFERGRSDAVVRMRELYPDSKPAKEFRTWERTNVNEPDTGATVIPNFYDPRDYPYNPNAGGDYLFFIGRVHPCKGLTTAIKLAEYTGEKLVVAGPGDINSAGVPIPKNVEYVGVLDLEARGQYYHDAIACVLPSEFLEPGHSTHIEAGYAGRPIIVPNQGITMDFVRQGVNGFRCHPNDFPDYVEAYERINDEIAPADCRAYAMNFSMDRVSLVYHEWFHKIIANAHRAKWEVPERRVDLEWLSFPEFPYPAEKVEQKITAIQGKIEAETADVALQKKGVCVQIGIKATAEFAYLADRDWREKSVPELKQIPNTVADGITDWQYYGVDADVNSIASMLQKYRSPQMQWVNAYIGTEIGKLSDVTSLMPGTPMSIFKGATTTLKNLFSDLGLAAVDVLAIDIEGSELEVLSAYDWSLKPRYITVEAHGDPRVPNCANPNLLNANTETLITLLESQGYTLQSKTDTNWNKTGYCTRELAFLLE